MASGPAAAVSGGIGGRCAVYFVVRSKKYSGERLEYLGYCGADHIPFLLHQADGEIIEGGKAVQFGSEGGGFLETHQAADEITGRAGTAGCPGIV